MSVKSRLDGLAQGGGRAGVPLAYYPGRKLIGASMTDILSDSKAGAECLAAIENTWHPAMLVRMTELWVEAEAFGAQVEIKEHGFPVMKSKVIPDIEDIGEVAVPTLEEGRLPVFIDAIKRARELLPEALLFAGTTGPFSLGSCLTDAEELMMACYTDPEEVHGYLQKITEFLLCYCKAYKAAGASGVFIAEPSICMLSPDMADEFSHCYLKEIISRVQDDDFAVVYHNCGDVALQLNHIKELGAAAYHFGDAVLMGEVLKIFPKDVPVLGNIHPEKFMPGQEELLVQAINAAKAEYGTAPNFIISSGCDIAPDASIEAIKALMS